MDLEKIRQNTIGTILQFSVPAIVAMMLPSFFFCGINAITSFYFTAIGNAFASALISLTRGLVVLLACILSCLRILA